MVESNDSNVAVRQVYFSLNSRKWVRCKLVMLRNVALPNSLKPHIDQLAQNYSIVLKLETECVHPNAIYC